MTKHLLKALPKSIVILIFVFGLLSKVIWEVELKPQVIAVVDSAILSHEQKLDQKIGHLIDQQVQNNSKLIRLERKSDRILEIIIENERYKR